jgi:hypothetical protein
MTFNHYYKGSSPLDLKKIHGYRLMVDHSSSKRFVPIRIRLAVGVSSLIGRGFSCHESRCRFKSGLTRFV